MQLKYIYAAVMLSAPLWLTGCLSGIPNPLNNPPPRERDEVVVDNYEKYEAISLTKKVPILNEGFDNNTRGWKVGGGTDYTMTIAAGEMYIGTLSTARQNTISLADLKEADNFEIETRVKMSSITSSNGGNSLLWGGSTSSWYFFRGNPYTGAIEIGREARPSINDSGFMSTEIYNVLTVRKVKHLYYYFINGKYIGKEMVNSFYGPAIGFEAGRNTSMWVDYLKVSRLTL
jgi:hypothetical protein